MKRIVSRPTIIRVPSEERGRSKTKKKATTNKHSLSRSVNRVDFFAPILLLICTSHYWDIIGTLQGFSLSLMGKEGLL